MKSPLSFLLLAPALLTAGCVVMMPHSESSPSPKARAVSPPTPSTQTAVQQPAPRAIVRQPGTPPVSATVTPPAPIHSAVPMPTDVTPLITLPTYATELKGNNEVRFHNPNEFPVLVVIRSGNKGMNLKVAADATGSALLPDGHYNISLVFATEPNALYRSERFDLPAPNVMEINISLFTRGSLGAGK